MTTAAPVSIPAVQAAIAGAEKAPAADLPVKAVARTSDAQQRPNSGASASAEAMQAVAKQIQKYLASAGRTLDIRVDDKTSMIVVTVKDSQTGDVIRQIPNEEAVRLAQLLDEQAHGNTGALLDQIV